MSAAFDPYYEWLGIPPADSANGGPHHYRLLGLQTFESNPRVIENAADRLMTQLRGFAAGPKSKDSQKLLNEVAAARACLLDEKRKAAYDKPLRARLAAAAPKPQAAAPVVHLQPVYVQVPVPVPVPTAVPPMPASTSAPPPPGEASVIALDEASPAPFTLSTSRSANRYRAKSEGGTVMGIVKIAMGGLGGLAVAVLGVWIFFRADPLGLFTKPATVAGNTQITPVQPKPEPKPFVKPEQPPEIEPGEKPEPTPTAPEESEPPSTRPAPETPSQPESPAEPMPNPRPLPGIEQQPADPPQTPETRVDERPQPPTSEEQLAKLAELKEIYKAEFDAGAKPAGREAFVEFLLETTDRLKSDPVARFVLLREAYTKQVAAKEFDAAADVIDRLDAEFLMDPFKLRLHLLTEASPAARLPADRLAIVNCAGELVERAMARLRIDEADKLVRIAEGQAKSLNDTKLRAKMTALRLQVEKLAESWAPALRARQALATDPDDAAAALIDGKYRCLIEGDWKAGLQLLTKSDEPPLAALAAKDLAGPTAELPAVAIADEWYEIARADKALENFYARAHHWYKQAPTGEGLERARIQQRIEHIEALDLPERLLEDDAAIAISAPLPSFAAAYAGTQSFDVVDLMQHVQRQDLAASPWGATTDMPPTLYSDDDTPLARLPVRYAVPREYQLTIHVRRNSPIRFGPEGPMERASGPFVIGLVGPKSPFMACVDLPAMGGEFATFLSVADAKSPADNPTYRKLSFAQLRRDAIVVCQVRKKSVSVTINSNEVCRYEGDLAKLALPREWSVGDPKALFLGSHQCGYSVTGWTLEPLPAESSSPTLNAGAIPFGMTQDR
jgi:hypothetical protein